MLPTLIIVAQGAGPSLPSLLRVCLASGLPLRVVGDCPEASAQARAIVRASDVIELTHAADVSRADRLVLALRAGVLASSQASGWLLLPAEAGEVQADTLRSVAQGVMRYTAVYPQYRQQHGHPLGLASELFSEILRLNNERDLARLIARYPTVGLHTDDPGSLIAAKPATRTASAARNASGTQGSSPLLYQR